jgi:hypothetical protein
VPKLPKLPKGKPLAVGLFQTRQQVLKDSPFNFGNVACLRGELAKPKGRLWQFWQLEVYFIEAGISSRVTSRMANEDFQGSVLVLVLYDVCDEISLAELQALVGGKSGAPAFKHTTPEYVGFQRAPVVESVEAVTLETGEQFETTIQYYEYGVIGALLQLSYLGTWARLQEVASRWTSSPFFGELTHKLVSQRIEHLRPALRKPYKNWSSEEYYIFHLHAYPARSAQELLREQGQDISQLIDGETAPLSAVERDEVLQASISYYPHDLAVVGWNAAFIYDTESGAQSTIRILEYANSQLLQFRHYDELLTLELRDGYRLLENRRGLLARWRMRFGASRLRAVLLEVTELTERTNHALKFVGDMFSARLYRLCANKIGVNEFQALVQEKMKTADDMYDFMIEQFNQSRGFLLESIVVIILIIELVALFRGK